MATLPRSHGLPDPLVDYMDVDGHDPRRLTLDRLFCDGELLLAQGRDTHFLALVKLADPYQRLDGKFGRYCVVYRYLSVSCTNSLDEAWCCVKSDEYTYWLAHEIRPVLQTFKSHQPVDLFNHFNIF